MGRSLFPRAGSASLQHASGRLEKLESLRGFAAAYVMVGHVASMYFHGEGRWTLIFRLAVEAVMLFFLLSGFVIRYSSPPGTHTFRAYFVKRFRRIYPLYLIALAVSYGCAALADGRWRPDGFGWGRLLGNLFMLQDAEVTNPGVWVAAFINPVFWSLSYEWWFYMMYYPLGEWKAREETKNWVVFGVSAAATIAFQIEPNWPCMVLAMLAIWWSGGQLAAEYMESGDVTFGRQWKQLGRLLVIAGLWSIPQWTTEGARANLGAYPMWPLRCYVGVVVMLTVGIAWKRAGFVGFRWTFGLFTIFAPISYAVYVFHFPPLDLLEEPGLSRWPAAGLAVFVVGTMAWSYLMEVRLQRWINGKTKGWLGRVREGALGSSRGQEVGRR